jgi:hypothetical protein
VHARDFGVRATYRSTSRANPGTAIASNVFVGDAGFNILTLTNLSAQTNLLPLNVKKEIEVPIK